MRTTNPDLMMTDSQSFMLSAPNPVSGLKTHAGQSNENWMGFSRFLTTSGVAHAMRWWGRVKLTALGRAIFPRWGEPMLRRKCSF